MNLQPKRPAFIALSFSGGGFRAAAYSLGCLSYLDHATIGGQKLTSLVHFVSSASGGSITNLVYSASQRQGKSFAEFYNLLQTNLQGSGLVDRVFQILKEDAFWEQRPQKTRNIINAFSIAYDELLFQGATFNLYLQPVTGVVPEICVNTTEFNNGMLFRFQNAGKAGNHFIWFKKDAASRQALGAVKLGDILACSSCFTVGFEPFMFPHDFSYNKLTNTQLRTALVEDTRFSPAKGDLTSNKPTTTGRKDITFGLMDGGIDDNQGIDSFIKAEGRLQKKNEFGYDLYMACDVSSNYTSGYDSQPIQPSWLLRPSIKQYVIGVMALFVAALAGVFWGIWTGLSYALLGISAFLLLCIGYLVWKGGQQHRKSKREKETFGNLLFTYGAYFLKIPLHQFVDLLFTRGRSAGYLAGVVFLKKIRRISYDRLYEKISLLRLPQNPAAANAVGTSAKKIVLKQWRQFAIQNALYLLSPKNDHQRSSDLKKEPWYSTDGQLYLKGQPYRLQELLLPSPKLQQVADLATSMDTTLWFDANHMNEQLPAALIAAGHFTTCYNLLCYALRFEDEAGETYWKDFQESLAQDWEDFNLEPYYLYNDYGNSQVGFQPLFAG
jgi:hypothetical protein